MSAFKKKALAVVVLILFAALALLAYIRFSPEAAQGSKTVYFEVTHSDTSKKEFTITTYAETLREALESDGLIEGDDGDFGLFVTAVDGESADSSLHQWWKFEKDGEMLPAGVDDTMISDGEHYQAVLDVY